MANNFADHDSPGTMTQPGHTESDMAGSAVDLSETRVRAVMAAARHNGVELERGELRKQQNETVPSPAALVAWLRASNLWAKATRLRWSALLKLTNGTPVVLLFNDGSAGLLVQGDDKRNLVWVKDPRGATSDPPLAVDELRLAQVWSGEVLLVRRSRVGEVSDERFSLGWLVKQVMFEKAILRSTLIASISISFLTIVPPLAVMALINQVLTHRSMSTLAMIALMLSISVAFEVLLTFARRELLLVLAARLDTRLSLHVFSRLLGLPLDYFERTPAGETTYKLGQLWQIREFLIGKLMTTVLDLVTLAIMLPLLFVLSSTLSWFVLAGSVVIALSIAAFLPALRKITGQMISEEAKKGSVLAETVYGMRTVKALALEGARKELWDERVAEAARLRVQAGRLANWAQAIALPCERFIERGVIMVGAYMLLTGTSDMQVGSLVAFMMLGGRVAQPLVGLAHLLEEMETVNAAVAQVGFVLNQAPESRAGELGLRPRFEGAISYSDLTFTYNGAKTPALDRVNFEIPAGTMLGLVGRSGSGKSTITRLLQGISRNYSGFLKIDGVELREINLTHLRRSFGVVLQDNFLFRGTVRDNIIANRPGLTLEDAIRAARLAGAEEFIERLPQGYETWIEEGSSNLSGGQRQRLAIARAIICDPRILILDEATSALDPESEALVNANLLRIARGRTMVIVSHRLSSLLDCDNILVMDKGTVLDMAPHRVLVERCAVYRHLWMQQNRHMDAAQNRTGVTPVRAEGDD
jgi:subfamily B ATP-binding cassette protein HlyB/CyaB